MYKLNLQRTREQIANINWITENARKFRKKSTSASLTTLKPLAVWITIHCGKFLQRDGNTKSPYHEI